jgi:hypothetical protein
VYRQYKYYMAELYRATTWDKLARHYLDTQRRFNGTAYIDNTELPDHNTRLHRPDGLNTTMQRDNQTPSFLEYHDPYPDTAESGETYDIEARLSGHQVIDLTMVVKVEEENKTQR